MAFDKRSKVSLTFGTNISHRLIRLNIFRKYYDFIEKMNISRFSHINLLEIKFDLAIK